jgi:hypothetical protein
MEVSEALRGAKRLARELGAVTLNETEPVEEEEEEERSDTTVGGQSDESSLVRRLLCSICRLCCVRAGNVFSDLMA